MALPEKQSFKTLVGCFRAIHYASKRGGAPIIGGGAGDQHIRNEDEQHFYDRKRDTTLTGEAAALVTERVAAHLTGREAHLL